MYEWFPQVNLGVYSIRRIQFVLVLWFEQMLISRCVNVSTRNNDSKTALFLAALNNYVPIVQALIRAGKVAYEGFIFTLRFFWKNNDANGIRNKTVYPPKNAMSTVIWSLIVYMSSLYLCWSSWKFTSLAIHMHTPFNSAISLYLWCA